MDEDEALIAWLADTTGSDDLKGWPDVTRARAVSELLSAIDESFFESDYTPSRAVSYFRRLTGYAVPTPDRDDPRANARLALAIAVHSDDREDYVRRIQTYSAQAQAHLMSAIESVVQSAKSNDELDRLRDELQSANERIAAFQSTQKPASALRSEIDALQSDLTKAETLLVESDKKNESQSSTIASLERQVSEWAPLVREYERLKDEHDEWKHQIEKARKSENVIEKYRRKLEDMTKLRADLRKVEDENERLVETNVALEEELSKLRHSRPLLDQLKVQAEQAAKEKEALEARNATLEEQIASLRARTVERRRLSDDESPSAPVPDDDVGVTGTALGESFDTGGESSLTVLRKRVIELERRIASSSSSNAADIDDSHLKQLEHDWLEERRAKVALEAKLNEIMSSPSPGSSALRGRVEELETRLRDSLKDRDELSRRAEAVERELETAQSNLDLVDKDQLDVLNSLRASVEQSSKALEARLSSLETELGDHRAKLESKDRQIDSLLERQNDDSSRATEVDAHRLERDRLTHELTEMRHRVGELEQEQGDAVQLKTELERLQIVTKERQATLERELTLIRSAWHETQLKCQRQALALASLVDQHARGAQTTGNGENGGVKVVAGQKPDQKALSWLAQQRSKAVRT